MTGVVLLALFIWYAGPLFAFGPYRPLESELVRIIVIALVIVAMVVAKIVQASPRQQGQRQPHRRSGQAVDSGDQAERGGRSSCASGSKRRWRR